MCATHRWRRSSAFKGTIWLLVVLTLLGPVTAAARPAMIYASLAQRRPARPPLRDPRPADEPIVPRRLHPWTVEIIRDDGRAAAGDPWALFDGSAATAFSASGTIRVRATLAMPTRLVSVAVWGGGAGALSVSGESDGRAVPLDGLADIDLGARPNGWSL